MLRRTFLLGSGAAVASSSQQAPPPAHFAKGYENPLGNLKLRNLPELSIESPKCVVKRRLWSDWSSAERKSLAKAYRSLTHGAKDAAKINQGLLHAAWWHGHFCCDHPGDDIPPDEASTDDIHHTWAFLPWHRAFIYFHERLLARRLGDDFRLPVWQWEAEARVPEFYETLPAPFVTGPRRKGRLARPFSDCYLRAWLATTRFEDFVGTEGPGQAEVGAHAAVHAWLGGAMANLAVAAADPLFFSHHANVDRFWWHWSTQLNLPVSYQFAQECVYFYDLNGRLGKVKIGNLLDTTTLGYTYDPPTVKITGLVPSLNLLNSVPSISEKLLKLIDELPVEFARLYALSLQFLPAIPQDVLKASLTSPDSLSRQNLLATLRRVFSTPNVSVSLQTAIQSASAMKNYPVGIVALRHPNVSEPGITIGEVYSNSQMTMPPCVPLTACLAGSQVVPLIELLVSTSGMPQVVWGSSSLRSDGITAINPASAHITTFCGPLQILNYQDSLAYLTHLL
jgi:hypothetical protein